MEKSTTLAASAEGRRHPFSMLLASVEGHRRPFSTLLASVEGRRGPLSRLDALRQNITMTSLMTVNLKKEEDILKKYVHQT